MRPTHHLLICIIIVFAGFYVYSETVFIGYFAVHQACTILIKRDGRIHDKVLLVESALPSGDGYVALKNAGCWSYQNLSTGDVIKSKLAYASRFRTGVARFKDRDGWALLFRDGNEIRIQGNYDYVGIPCESLCAVLRNEKAGFIGLDGNLMLPIEYDIPVDKSGKRLESSLWFSDGYCMVRKEGKQVFINHNGGVLRADLSYHAAGNFNGGFAPIEYNGSCTYISVTGAVMEKTFQNANVFTGEHAVVVTQVGRDAVINMKGEVVFECTQTERIIGNAGFGRVLVFDRQRSKYRYVALHDMTSSPEYEFATPICWGISAVKLNGIVTLMNEKGDTIARECYPLEIQGDVAAIYGDDSCLLSQEASALIPEVVPVGLPFNRFYDLRKLLCDRIIAAHPRWLLSDFCEGVAVCLLNDEEDVGLCYPNGELLSSETFAEARPFSEGLAAVKTKRSGMWGYIKKSGSLLSEPRYLSALSFHNGYSVVASREDEVEIFKIIDKSEVEQWRAPKGHILIESCGPYWPVEIHSLLHNEQDNSIVKIESSYYVDKDGRKWSGSGGEIIKCTGFSEGFAFAKYKEDSGYSLIKSSGVIVVRSYYAECSMFSEGLCAVRINNDKKWSIIDCEGNILVRNRYNSIDKYKDGFSIASINSFCGVIDSKGREVTGIVFRRIYR